MIAFKGFTKDLKSVHGNGDQEQCSFTVGVTKTTKESKTVRSGFHCCENPTGCLAYYGWNDENRFFMVDAEGNIDEDEQGRTACTEITLVKEMDTYEFVYETIVYMLNHPQRTDWETNHGNFVVTRDYAKLGIKPQKDQRLKPVLIARGENPRVNGREGSIAAILKETDGEITEAKIFKIEGWMDEKDLHLAYGEIFG